MTDRPLRLALAVFLLATTFSLGCVGEEAPLAKLEGDATPEDFDLAADSLSRPTRVGDIAAGATVGGRFSPSARYLAWSFPAASGELVEITAEGVSPRGLDTVAAVYRASASLRPMGRALASNDDCDTGFLPRGSLGSCLAWTAREAGTYLVVVRRYDRGSSGSFSLRLDATSASRPCGSRGLGACGAGEYCSFGAEATCGRTDRPGVCARRPDACTALRRPVCGCDGASYESACAAARAGVSVEREGECPAGCASEIGAIQEAAAAVWFLSESDRPITVQVREGPAGAPSLESVLAQAMAPAGAIATVRETARFARAFEPAPGSPEDAPARLRAALGALSDVLYVAITDPTMRAEVRVILVGRTRCGDLVWLESVSIET
jgi:hypothetical protein